jgi:hypothetical protein
MDTQKPFNKTHETNLTAFTEETTEESLNVQVFREINEVVNIKPKRKQNRGQVAVGLSGSRIHPV